jgi:hypothetical protein
MNAKQKARHLVDKFGTIEHALMCVDEILYDLEKHNSHYGYVYSYWEEVKQEINKL